MQRLSWCPHYLLRSEWVLTWLCHVLMFKKMRWVSAGALVIIRECMPNLANKDGEIELDFMALDQETLWQLDEYVSSLEGRKRGKQGAKRTGSQLPEESESDSDTDSDSD